MNSGNALATKMLSQSDQHLDIYIIPHSHTDIGFTDLQTKVESQHIEFIDEALDIEVFKIFEKRYNAQIPQVKGDWTPYWEDDAASTAREIRMSRAASERLTQAEALS